MIPQIEPFQGNKQSKLTKVLNPISKPIKGKFQERAKQLDLALFRSATFEDKLDSLNNRLSQSEHTLDQLSKALFDFHNLPTIDDHLTQCQSLADRLAHTGEDIDEFKEICEKLMQNCANADDRDIIEKRMENMVYTWSVQTLKLDENRANLTFLDRHLKELDASYRAALAFTGQLNLRLTSELKLNCIEPIVIKATGEWMREAVEEVAGKREVIGELKVDTNNLLSIYEDFESAQAPKQAGKVENKLIACLPKTISSAQLFALACMLNKPEIEANVHEIDFKYSDYKFHLGKQRILIRKHLISVPIHFIEFQFIKNSIQRKNS